MLFQLKTKQKKKNQIKIKLMHFRNKIKIKKKNQNKFKITNLRNKIKTTKKIIKMKLFQIIKMIKQAQLNNKILYKMILILTALIR